MLTYNKEAAIEKLNKFIEAGRESAGTLIQHVMDKQPKDELATAGNLKFSAESGDSPAIRVKFADESNYTIHKHALLQMSAFMKIPSTYAENLRDTDWGTELLATTLNTHFQNKVEMDKQYLMRSIDGNLRGFLSDRYRRIDSRPLVDTFATCVAEAGALPYRGTVTDTKINIAAVFPTIYEPIPGEIVAYGLTLENSDYGVGAVSLRSHMLRIWCNNLMVTEETMREVHLGKRLTDDMIYSQDTYRLDGETVVSALKDVMKHSLTKETIEAKMDAIKAADAKTLNADEVKNIFKNLQTGGKITKLEAENAANVFAIGGMEHVPEKASMWKLSNALSWIAKDAPADRAMDLNKLAGSLL